MYKGLLHISHSFFTRSAICCLHLPLSHGLIQSLFALFPVKIWFFRKLFRITANLPVKARNWVLNGTMLSFDCTTEFLRCELLFLRCLRHGILGLKLLLNTRSIDNLIFNFDMDRMFAGKIVLRNTTIHSFMHHSARLHNLRPIHKGSIVAARRSTLYIVVILLARNVPTNYS